MAIDRRHDMLRGDRSRWTDKPFYCLAILFFLALIVNFIVIFALSDEAKGVTDIARPFLERPLQLNWCWLRTIISLTPALSYTVALLLMELILALPSVIILYGRYLLMVFDVILLMISIYNWPSNIFLIGAVAAANIGYSLVFYLGKDVKLWRDVVIQTRKDSSFVSIRLSPSLIASVADNILIFLFAYCAVLAGSVWTGFRSFQFHSALILLSVWVMHTLTQTVLRGCLMSNFMHKLFLSGTENERKRPVQRSLRRLMTNLFGSVFLSSLYYGTRSGLLMCFLLGFNFRLTELYVQGTFFESLGIVISNLLLISLLSSQRFRSLFQIVAYSYSCSEALMLTEVYPSMKVDLINKFASVLALLSAVISAGVAQLLLLKFGNMHPADATRLTFLIAVQANMTAQMVFEPMRAASFTLAVGLVEDPKWLMVKLPWAKQYYPPYH